VTLVWHWNISQSSNIARFIGYDFLYPRNTIFCSITHSKEVIEHRNCDFPYLWNLGGIIGKNICHRQWPQTNLRKDLIEIMKLLFLHHWHLRFWRRIFLNNLPALEDVGLSMTLKWRSRSNLGHELYYMCWVDHSCKK
jgi:hypothetical protein